MPGCSNVLPNALCIENAYLGCMLVQVVAKIVATTTARAATKKQHGLQSPEAIVVRPKILNQVVARWRVTGVFKPHSEAPTLSGPPERAICARGGGGTLSILSGRLNTGRRRLFATTAMC